MEFMQSFMGNHTPGVPSVFGTKHDSIYSPADTVVQYMELFNKIRKQQQVPVAGIRWKDMKGLPGALCRATASSFLPAMWIRRPSKKRHWSQPKVFFFPSKSLCPISRQRFWMLCVFLVVLCISGGSVCAQAYGCDGSQHRVSCRGLQILRRGKERRNSSQMHARAEFPWMQAAIQERGWVFYYYFLKISTWKCHAFFTKIKSCIFVRRWSLSAQQVLCCFVLFIYSFWNFLLRGDYSLAEFYLWFGLRALYPWSKLISLWQNLQEFLPSYYRYVLSLPSSFISDGSIKIFHLSDATNEARC